jgi:hypothetical protein
MNGDGTGVSSLSGLLRLFMVSITIKLTTYLWKSKMDLSRSNVDDCIGGVEERSPQDDRCVFISRHVEDQEVDRNILILNFYQDILCHAFRPSQ